MRTFRLSFEFSVSDDSDGFPSLFANYSEEDWKVNFREVFLDEWKYQHLPPPHTSSFVCKEIVNKARKGGLARAKKLKPQIRSRIAKKAANARWNKPKS